MKKEEIIIKLKKHMLFGNTDEKLLYSLIDSDSTKIISFDVGETIFSENNHEKKLGLILSGSAVVHPSIENSSAMLTTLSEGDAFGVSNLFVENMPFVSLITAKKTSKVIFFPNKSIEQLLDISHEFRKNYIVFLSQKICFLNQKISCFTAGSNEQRLAVYLCSCSKDDSFSLNINASTLAELLNMGRASLYRAFDKLIGDGFIIKDGKRITVQKISILQNYYNN